MWRVDDLQNDCYDIERSIGQVLENGVLRLAYVLLFNNDFISEKIQLVHRAAQVQNKTVIFFSIFFIIILLIIFL